VQRIGELMVSQGHDPDALPLKVVRNDKITVAQAAALNPSHLIVSPGPCTPREGGVSNDIIQHFAGRVPLLGVCLGHQCIAYSFGMTVDRNVRLMHGKTSPIFHDGQGIFRGMSNPFTATRYHSLVILPPTFDAARFEKSAWTQEGEIMGIRAKPALWESLGLNPATAAPLEGVQFHPESFLTTQGPRLLANFLGLPAPTVPA
jgi:anthranilate synthase/aminodeoxychorismate synthase-like glutamine amidotransferase